MVLQKPQFHESRSDYTCLSSKRYFDLMMLEQRKIKVKDPKDFAKALVKATEDLFD